MSPLTLTLSPLGEREILKPPWSNSVAVQINPVKPVSRGRLTHAAGAGAGAASARGGGRVSAAGLCIDRKNGELFFELRALAVRALGGLGALNEKLELLLAAGTEVFVNGHGAILNGRLLSGKSRKEAAWSRRRAFC